MDESVWSSLLIIVIPFISVGTWRRLFGEDAGTEVVLKSYEIDDTITERFLYDAVSAVAAKYNKVVGLPYAVDIGGARASTRAYRVEVMDEYRHVPKSKTSSYVTAPTISSLLFCVLLELDKLATTKTTEAAEKMP